MPILLEFTILIVSCLILVLLGGDEGMERTGIFVRCEILAAVLFVASIFVVITTVCIDCVTTKMDGGFRAPWKWWRQLARAFLQANAALMTALALLEHSTLVLLQIFTLLANASWTLACSSVVIWFWQLHAPTPESVGLPIIVLLKDIRRVRFFIGSAICTILGFVCMLVKPMDKLPLSDEIQLGEHFALFYVGGMVISGAMTFLFLCLTARGHKLVQLRHGQAPSPFEVVIYSAIISVGCHVFAAMALLGFFVPTVITMVIGLSTLALRLASLPPPKKKPQTEVTVFITRTVSRLSTGTSTFFSRTKDAIIWFFQKLRPQSSAKMQNGRSSTRTKKRRAACMQRLRKAATASALIAVGFFKVGAIFSVFIFDVQFVAKYMRKESSTCATRVAVANGETMVPVGESAASTGEDQTSASAFMPKSPSLLGDGLRSTLTDMGFGFSASRFGDALDWLMGLFDWVLDGEMFVPSGVMLRCTGVRRLASSIAVSGCVLIILIVIALDLISILEATKEIADTNAHSRNSFLSYLVLTSSVQLLAELTMQVVSVTVASASRLKYEAAGFFVPECGYLANHKHLTGGQCPNVWHFPVDFLAAVLLFASISIAIIIFMAVLTGAFYGLPATQWATRAFFGRYLKFATVSEEQAPASTEENCKNTETDEKKGMTRRFACMPILFVVAKPFVGLLLTFGIWSSWASQLHRCGKRQDWYEPAEVHKPPEAQEEEVADEDGEEEDGNVKEKRGVDSEGASSVDCVTWKAMYCATSKSIALLWTPVPVFGGLLSKGTNYFNAHVVFAFGIDSEPILSHFLKGKAAGVQALNWVSDALLFAILLLIEFDLLDRLSLEQRLRVLGACILVVIGIATLRIVTDIIQQLTAFKRSRGLAQNCEQLVVDGYLHEVLRDQGDGPDAPMFDLPEKDRKRVVYACRCLCELSWAKQGHKELPENHKAQLANSRWQSNRLAKVANYVAQLEANAKGDIEKSRLKSHKNAAVAIVLRECAEPEIQRHRAREKVATMISEKAQADADDLRGYLEDFAQRKARKMIFDEAKCRATELKSRVQYGKHESADERVVNIKLQAEIRGTTRVTARPLAGGKNLLDPPAQSTVSLHATVIAEITWAKRCDPSTFSEHEAEVEDSYAFKIVKSDCVVKREARANASEEKPSPRPSSRGTGPRGMGPPQGVEVPFQLGKTPSRQDVFPARENVALTVSGMPAEDPAKAEDSKLDSKLEEFEDEMDAQYWQYCPFSRDAPESAYDEYDNNVQKRQNEESFELVPLGTSWGCGKKEFKGVRELEDFYVSMHHEFSPELKAWKPGAEDRTNTQLELEMRNSELASKTMLNTGMFLGEVGEGCKSSEARQVANNASRRAMELGALKRFKESILSRRSDAEAPMDNDNLSAEDAASEQPANAPDAAAIRMEAEERLQQALLGKSIEDITAKLDMARQVGVDSGILALATDKLNNLKAKHDLVAALQTGLIEDLRAAITTARSMPGLAAELDASDEDLLGMAEARLKVEEEELLRKQRIGRLKEALDTNNAFLLRSSIAECEQEDLTGEVDLEMAKKRLEVLENAMKNVAMWAPGGKARGLDSGVSAASIKLSQARAIANLRTALCQETTDRAALELAIAQVEASGALDAPELERAYAMLRSERSKAVTLDKVKQAAEKRDPKSLSKYIERGVQLGVSPGVLLGVVSKLFEELAGVARRAGDHGLGNAFLADLERERRALHNRAQAAKGGLRTVVRIRPAVLPGVEVGLPGAVDGGVAFAVTGGMAGEQVPTVIRMDRHTLAVNKLSARTRAPSARDDTFRFGAVCGPDSAESELVAEMDGMVQSAVDGYNILLMACGPRGGGKTHTLFGDGAASRGLALKAVDELFSMRDHDSWRATLEVDLQMVEVRDASLVADLLNQGPPLAAGGERPSVRLVPVESAGEVGVARGADGAASVVVVDGVTTRRTARKHDLLAALQEGRARATRGCHVLTILHLTRSNIATGATTKSKMVFADLAGMGRQAAPPVGIAYKALEGVLRAVAARQQRVPYRSHVLTQLLQDCIGGGAKMLLVLALAAEHPEQSDTLQAIALASHGSW